MFLIKCLAMSRQRPTGECNDFKIKSGGFTYVIPSSGSDRRLTERIFCIHYFGMVFIKNIKIFYDNNVKSIECRNFSFIDVRMWYAHLSYLLNSTDS